MEVIWDSLGISGHQSGISYFAHRLCGALEPLGLKPSRLNLSPNLGLLEGLRPWLIRSELDRKNQRQGLILHGLSNYNLALKKRAHERFVLTLHDLIPLKKPRLVSLSLQLKMQSFLPQVLEVADRIICVSTFTKNELLSLFPSLSPKTTVIPHGSDIEFNGPPKAIELNKIINLLYISRPEVYKRIEFCLELLKLEPRLLRLNLVSTGPELMRLSKKYADLINLGALRLYTGLGESELKNLYEICDLYIQPSLYEGYGLPIVRALNYGLYPVYVGGSATEIELEGLGLIMDSKAGPRDWLEQILGLTKARPDQSYQKKRMENLQNRPSWADVGMAYLRLYQEL